MGDKEDEETMFQEAAKTAWVRLFLSEASKQGHPIEDIAALLDEPGLTMEKTVKRLLFGREPNVAPKAN
jgi:hypothetical protein